ncbi:hypothetical protein CLAIMM_01382 [Cladophialophora immunda]|nr:hypothetical protein CLAIMM_01382 [Cladophialophora immunda]
MVISPFRIDIPNGEVERLKRKLRDTRIPKAPIVPGANGDYGPPIEWFQRLSNKWRDDFDWPSVQEHLNRHCHFLADINDESFQLKVHFTHTKSARADAIPLIMVHGWPGSFHEFDRVVDAFANPKDPSDPAFHVVVPSLPGFCWSSPPPRRGWTMQDTARVFNKLMSQLGYAHYVVQAGDWGSFVAREMGAKFMECKAVHLNFCPVEVDDSVTDLTPREMKIKERYHDWLNNHLGYAVCMRTRPQTIGVALNDNPVGILAWVGEKYIEAAAPANVESSEPAWDQAILTTCSLYYFTDCIMSSTLPYFEGVKHADFGNFFLKQENYIEVPMGYTSFLYDTRPGTERSVKKTGRLVFYNECDDGGHFAALERPDVILADCRKFFGEWISSDTEIVDAALDAPESSLNTKNGRITCIYFDKSGRFNGEHKQLTKAEIGEQFDLRHRDLRDIDLKSEAVTRILVRPATILLQFFQLCMIIQADEALLIYNQPQTSSERDDEADDTSPQTDDREFYREFEQRMSGPTVETAGVPELPYELRAVEAALVAVLSGLRQDLIDARHKAEESAASLQLDSGLAAVGLNLVFDRTRRLSKIEQKARLVRDTIREVLDTDEDLAGMYLSDHLGGKPHATADHQEAEYMLEAYHKAADTLVESAQAAVDILRKKENTFRSSLAVQRNQIMFLEARIAIHTLGLAAGTMAAGLFGMNLLNYLEDAPYGFFWVAGACVVLSAIFSMQGMRSLRRIQTLKGIQRSRVGGRRF